MSDEKRTEATPAQADAASDAKAIKGKTDAQAALDETARLDNTQELPPLPDDLQGKPEEAPIKQPFPQAGDEAPISDVRELTPDKVLQQRAKQQAEARKKQQSWFLRHKKPLLLGVGFLIAVFIGFALAGYRQDQADLQNNERQHQEQQMQERAQKLDAQESDLQKQRRDLEAKKKALEEQQRGIGRTGLVLLVSFVYILSINHPISQASSVNGRGRASGDT
jgi:DNA repair exonuclease SbcCD ATPase subunit